MTCPECGASTLLLPQQTTCAQCGASLHIRTIISQVTAHYAAIEKPDAEAVRRQLLSALEHARSFYDSEGRQLTWKFTPTGASGYLDGEYAFNARIEETPGLVTEAIFITHYNHCPYCQGQINAASPTGEDEAAPKPGDFSICAYCTGTVVYTDYGGLRKATKAEIEDLDGEFREEMADAIRQIRLLQGAGEDTSGGLQGHRHNVRHEESSN